jgi:hypothetical protein
VWLPSQKHLKICFWSRAPVIKHEDICREKGLHHDISVGMPSHKEYVFRLCRETAILHFKGPRVKMGRWASWNNANRHYRGEKFVLLLIITSAS